MRTALLWTFVACTANQAPPDRPSRPGDPAGAERSVQATPTPDDGESLTLAPGELLRLRETGGSCPTRRILIVHDDGRFSETTYEDCWISTRDGPPAPRPPPKVAAGQLSPSELERLASWLATLRIEPQQRPDEPGGSLHAPRTEFVARTADGEVRGDEEPTSLSYFVSDLRGRLR